MRWFFVIILSFFAFNFLTAQQDEMLQGKRKQKRVWRRWRASERKNKTAYNPYLKKKKGDRISDKVAEGNKKEIRRQRKLYKKQLKEGKKKTRD